MNAAHIFRLDSGLQKVFFPYKGGVYCIDADQIIRLQADSNYTYIYTTNHKPILMAKVLGKYEKILKPLGFIRTHQSHLVNRMHVAHLSAQGQVIMADNSEAAVSRRKRKSVMNTISHYLIIA